MTEKITTNICVALNCPFRESKSGHGGCTRFSTSAMCPLNNIFDFTHYDGKKWRNNQYWLWGDDVTGNELKLMEIYLNNWLEQDEIENPRRF